MRPVKPGRNHSGGKKCYVDGCDSTQMKRGYCEKHFTQFYVMGNYSPVDQVQSRFEVLHELGKGAYGVVSLVRSKKRRASREDRDSSEQKSGEKLYALKEIKKEQFTPLQVCSANSL